ncbi:MAG: exopolyphosphatase [Planctomycetes bacterium]|nr:exopolyphosphatase [Planctomycetota bacterium]
MENTPHARDGTPQVPPATPVAVIDIGATSIRMAIGEIGSAGSVRTLESLSQAVSLGKDTFSEGSIRKSTIEHCVRVLKSYRESLKQFQISDPARIRVVATSAVREARNRMAFIDRIYIATGLEVEPIDEAEENRVTYLGVQQLLRGESSAAEASTIVTEVGGGSTELLQVKDGNVVFAHSFRLGSLRIRKSLEGYDASPSKLRKVMTTQIQRAVDEMRQQILQDAPIEMIAQGGDVRFAADHLVPDRAADTLTRVSAAELEAFTNRLVKMADDQIVRRYHLSYPAAETVGPALLTYVLLARAFRLEHVLVANTNLRDGLLREMAVRQAWTPEFRRQIVRSAVSLGSKYDYDAVHAQHVADLASKLFHQLQAEHRLDARHETILHIAALLHGVGAFVNSRNLHKHSMYLIQNSEVFGLGKRSLLLVALVARYHRRASPQPAHEGYANLARDDRVAVAKMAALLRVALALDESRSQRIREFTCNVEKSRLVITIPRADDLSLEQLAMNQNSTLFEEVFGLPVLLRLSR